MNAKAQEVITHRPVSPIVPKEPENAPGALMALIERAAADASYDAAKLEKLLELKERWDASEARKLYMQAVADFKRNPPVVVKDLLNKQYGSKYTSLANMVNTTNEALSAFGLNARWDFEQKDGLITVSCILSHSAGHSERVTLSGPPDKSGSKNPIQEVKSTITYLKLATFEGVTGIASRDGNTDDDGNTATPQEYPKLADWLAKIEECIDVPSLEKVADLIKKELIPAVPLRQIRAAYAQKKKGLSADSVERNQN